MSVTLRGYQDAGVKALRASFRNGKRAPLYVLPTGGGKTAVFSYIAQSMTAQEKHATILVHRQELLLQASQSLERFDVPHGMISPLFAQNRERIQVASVQTLVRRTEKVVAPDLLIIDEAHHATSDSYRKIIEAFPQARILGVTATPCRSDGAGLCEIFDDMVLGPSVSELISDGYLVEPEIYAPPVGIELEGVHRRMGDYDKRELGERIDRPSITGSAVEHYKRLCAGQPAIAFCVSVLHAEHVASEFRQAGIRATRVDGSMHDSDRRAAIEGLGDGTFDVVTSADLIGEGVDVPRVSCAILLRPTYSLALYLQQVGRALRPFPGKTRAIILDHVGNVMRHGFPDDPREWSLDARPSASRGSVGSTGVRIHQCEKCFYVFEAGPETCPACAHAQPSKVRQIKTVEGELEKLEREELERLKNVKRLEVGHAQTVEDLIAIGKERGYKNPTFWAKQIHSARMRKRAGI